MRMKTPTEHFLLASASPRRRELFALTGWHAEIRPAHIAEHSLPGERPESFVKRLALLKAQAAADACSNQHWVLAADTIVVDKETTLGKPADQIEAEQMLVQLASHSHLVITAIAVLDLQAGRNMVELCRTHVPMREYSQAEIKAYVASGSPLDKAGAYGIQDRAFHPVNVEQMNGCFANVMGLPLCHLVYIMRCLGVKQPLDVPDACQAHIAYTCSVYPEILRGEACANISC